MYRSLIRRNREQNSPDDDCSPTTEELYEKFKAMTPKQRNDHLQALFTAHLMNVAHIDDDAVELLKALMKSFNVSVKFQELDGSDDDLFDIDNTDIRKVREVSNDD